MSYERAWHPLQENKAIISKKVFFEKLRSCLVHLRYWRCKDILHTGKKD